MTPETPKSDETIPERFEPEATVPSLMKAEHWARYQVAAKLAPGRRVLDAGCGTGYGTRLLEDSGALSVTGLDASARALDSARQRCTGATLVQADLTNTSLADGTFDLIVCFEVIEHIEAHDEVIGELRRLLAPEGVLLISSPNRDVYLAGNPHHVRELTPDELDALLTTRFTNVAYLRQHPWVASAILTTFEHESSDPRVPAEAAVVKIDGIDAGRETYTIAVASNGELPEIRQLVALSEPTELSDYVEAIKALELRLAESEDALVAAGGRREAAIARQHAAEEELRSTEKHLDRANAAIENITSSVSWRVTAPLRALRRRKR